MQREPNKPKEMKRSRWDFSSRTLGLKTKTLALLFPVCAFNAAPQWKRDRGGHVVGRWGECGWLNRTFGVGGGSPKIGSIPKNTVSIQMGLE